MNLASAALFLAMIAALLVTVWGLFTKPRSVIISLTVGLFAVPVACVAFLLAGYAWTESHSLPWTIGYGVVFLIAVASALRHVVGIFVALASAVRQIVSSRSTIE